MNYIPGEDRGQAALLPAVIEDYVAASTSVRVAVGTSSTRRIVPTKADRRKPHKPPEPPWNPTPPIERDEHDALCEAITDFGLLLRYERPAWLRRRLAVRAFIAIKACTTA